MEPVIEFDGARVFHGDCRDVLAALPDNTFDSIVTDPPYELGFMGKSWDASGIAYNPDVWGQCLRVLKPGGHLLAFGGTRTWHRLAVAVEDAGFEVRDSIAWMYGQGFPKSLDVSKAIDKSLDAEREPDNYTGPNNLNNVFGQGMGGGQTLEKSDGVTSEAQKWQGWGTALKPAFEPIVVARKPLGAETAVRAIIENELNKRGETEIRWTRLASDAIRQSPSKHSGSTKPPKTAETFAKTASELEMQSTGETILNSIEQAQEGLRSETQADSESLQEKPKQTLGSKYLTITETSVPVVEKAPDSSLRSTTLKVGEIDTESALTGMSGQSLDETGSLTVIESFAGIATGLPGENASVLINKLSDGSFEWPDGLPEVFKTGNTVAETVLEWGTGGLNIDGSRIKASAEDFAKLSAGVEAIRKRGGSMDNSWKNSSDLSGASPANEAGRWPANVILDEVTAGLLDEQSGVSKSVSAKMGAGLVEGIGSKGLSKNAENFESVRGHNDTGGASRFFYCAKASKRDRNEGLEELPKLNKYKKGGVGGTGGKRDVAEAENATPVSNFHPTVKPTALMRYLVKLVTPPGGTVLDPFTGSGSTGKAAILEGFDFVGVELTDDYLPIIEGRLKWALDNQDERTLF